MSFNFWKLCSLQNALPQKANINNVKRRLSTMSFQTLSWETSNFRYDFQQQKTISRHVMKHKKLDQTKYRISLNPIWTGVLGGCYVPIVLCALQMIFELISLISYKVLTNILSDFRSNWKSCQSIKPKVNWHAVWAKGPRTLWVCSHKHGTDNRFDLDLKRTWNLISCKISFAAFDLLDNSNNDGQN